MSTFPARPPTPPRAKTPEPAWEVAYLFPPQGMWSEADYLELAGNRLVEFSDGAIEVLSMPTELHQLIMMFLCDALRAFVRAGNGGTVLVAPFRVRLREGKYREPDVMLMLTANAHRRGNEFWDGADLVMEIVSDDDPSRDLKTKRFEYAQARIPEYWIVDPRSSEITVLRLAGDHYEEHGRFGGGGQASSVLLGGFAVNVADVFAVR
jgi:Uma2 family endonuclease